jgi:DNA (cytosine-5)-methyltransferase 1
VTLTYGSLFAGYGGLEMGVSSVLGGRLAWFSEIELAPSRILAHHWPDVPNLGDVTAVDWGSVEPVDVLAGGFPCQDVSHAGKRLGLKPGTRSGLWSHMAYAIDKLRPSLVVAENVRGLLSAEAGGDLEPCPWCVGDGEGGALRALGAVQGDLADLGYTSQWVSVRASDAGAPHGRFRVFVFAWPAADTDGAARGERRLAAPGQAEGWWPRADFGGRGGAPVADADVTGRQGREPATRRHLPAWGAPADTTRDGRHEGRTEPTRLERGPDAALSGDAAPADAAGDHGRVDRQRDQGPRRPGRTGERDGGLPTGTDSRSDSRPVAWGDYEPAIRRWEHLTRPAPPPTEASRNGAARLSPRFVEWMQGLPAGHVTAVPGLSRNDQLKALGNGVVPQQAAYATRMWLAARLSGSGSAQSCA